MQDYTRWPMTALGNITMGRPGNERLLAMATAAAGTDRVIETFPAGYDTHLDRRFRGGTEPSGAQRQRPGNGPRTSPAPGSYRTVMP
jgi:ATP-binding cassette, subfamily B, bacterial